MAEYRTCACSSGYETDPDKGLHTFTYTAREGEQGEITLFVKRCVWKRRYESVHYRHLAECGVPAPHLYGAVVDAGGAEVIFLEPLERIGFDRRSEAEWRAMLSLLARLNACPIPPEYEPHLHCFEHVGRIEGGFWAMGLDAHPSAEQVKAGLVAGGIDAGEADVLARAAETLCSQVAAQPQALLHQDFLSDNVGWRRGSDGMAVLDLHKLARGPRFADVAGYLAQPDWSSDSAFLERKPNGETHGATRREALARHYLSEYWRFGGPEVPLERFRQETTALFWAHKIAALPWLQEHPARVRDLVEFLRTV